jgi:hypothetical protein
MVSSRKFKIWLLIVLCGDFNINYLAENDVRKQLDAMLISYYLTSGADFPTRIQNKSSTAIVTTFVNTFHYSNFVIIPQFNGLLDYYTLKMVYHSYFHSVINYGIIFRGNSSHSNSIFRLQKRILRTVMGVEIM